VRKLTKVKVMKTAIVVSASATAFESLAMSGARGRGKGLEKSFALISRAGFDGVEIAVRDPSRVDASRILELARNYGLEIAAIGTGQAFVDEGLCFTHPRASVRKKAVRRINDQLLLGKNLKAPVIIGLIRGILDPGLSVEDGLALLAECLKECASFGMKHRCPDLMLEPINRYETRLLNSVSEAAAFIRKLRRSNIRLMADTFHMNIEDRDISKSLKQAAPYLAHVHLADSNRWAPGQGHIDFKPVFSTLRRIRYKGYLSMEIMPKPDPETAVRLSAQFLKKHGLLSRRPPGKGQKN
jgi:sugar phosphate isomerase/epimerase